MKCILCHNQNILKNDPKRNHYPSWYLCEYCYLFQKNIASHAKKSDFVKNSNYRADSKLPTNDRYQERIQNMKGLWDLYTSRIESLKSPKVLDLGCGDGSFLAYLQNLQIDAIGVEPSVKYANFCKSKGLHVTNTYLEEANLEENSFDIIHSRNSGQFIRDFKETFRTFKLLLKPNRYLFMSGKQYHWNNSMSSRAFRKDSPLTCYFSNTSIQNILNICGFKKIYYQNKLGGFYLVAQSVSESNPNIVGNSFYENWMLSNLSKVDKIFFTLFGNSRKK
jgi:SAM-dependent methyltransferase